jgi:hypothetical protein
MTSHSIFCRLDAGDDQIGQLRPRPAIQQGARLVAQFVVPHDVDQVPRPER